MIFLVFAFILVALAWWFVLPALLGKSTTQTNDPQQSNVNATRQRLEDIDIEADYDLIGQDDLSSIREEAETTLLMELQEQKDGPVVEKSPLFHRFWNATVVVCIPLFAFLIYLSVGSPTAILESPESQSTQNEQTQLNELVGNLKQKLIDNPDDQQGWLVLAQTSMVTGQYDDAVSAMKQLYQLAGESSDILTRYADALTMANEGRFTKDSSQMVNRALELDPNHTHGLWLAGMNAYQSEQYENAVTFFTQAKSTIKDPENIAQLDDLIKAAKERGGVFAEQSDNVVQVKGEKVEAAGHAITVAVSLDQSLLANVNPQDAVFIFAKAASGPPMPLAVSKHTVSDLPITVQLNDAMAMMPGMSLSAFSEVIVSARVSKSSEPIAQPGDLQGTSKTINPINMPQIELVIDQIVE